MNDKPQFRPKNFGQKVTLLAAKTFYWTAKKWPSHFMPESEKNYDIYGSQMTENFNWLHNLIYPRFFKKISIESEKNIGEIKIISPNATIVYATTNIGQLEYNFFNYFFIKNDLPLAKFVNELSLWLWLPYKRIRHLMFIRAKRYVEHGPLKNPVRNGHIKDLLLNGQTIFANIRSTELFDDLYWYKPKNDPLLPLVEAAENNDHIFVVPLYFLWNKRPDGENSGSIFNIFPKFIRKNISFWRNYKNKAVVKIGEPIRLLELLANSAAPEKSETAKNLRQKLLSLFHQEKKVITGPPLKPREWIIYKVTDDEEVKKSICDVSLEIHKPVEDLHNIAQKYAEEIASDISYRYIETGSRLMKWVLKNIYDGIDVDKEGLERLKKAAASSPIALVPNHRSHMDYLLLSTVLYQNHVSIPHIAAGLNLSFWPMGHIFRRCGAFFLRRKFKGNKIYRAVFKSYLKLLLSLGYVQEFFIEGGRTRTGKLLPPKTGMLKMLCESVDAGASDELQFVPISITYERLLEEYKSELSGENKKSEKTLDLLRIAKFFKRKYGRIYIRFGEPIPYKATEAKDIEEKVNLIANQTMRSINRNVVVTGEAITSAAILTPCTKGITREEISTIARELVRYLEWKGACFSDVLKHDYEKAVDESLIKFINAKIINLHEDFLPACYEVKEDKRQIIDYYKNNIVHFFVSASIVAANVLSSIKKGDPIPKPSEIEPSYLLLKKIFANEFSFGTRLPAAEHISKIIHYFEAEYITNVIPRLELFKGIIRNYAEAYLAGIEACKGVILCEERTLIKRIVKYGQHRNLLGIITKSEAISGPIFANAINSFTALEILTVETDSKGRKIYSWTDQNETAEKVKLELELLS